MIDFDDARGFLERGLSEEGLKVRSSAFDPLQRIGFDKLINIHDREEKFLRDQLLICVLRSHRDRRDWQEGEEFVTDLDIERAINMLGRRVDRASESMMSADSKRAVREGCPYCK